MITIGTLTVVFRVKNPAPAGAPSQRKAIETPGAGRRAEAFADAVFVQRSAIGGRLGALLLQRCVRDAQQAVAADAGTVVEVAMGRPAAPGVAPETDAATLEEGEIVQAPAGEAQGPEEDPLAELAKLGEVRISDREPEAPRPPIDLGGGGVWRSARPESRTVRMGSEALEMPAEANEARVLRELKSASRGGERERERAVPAGRAGEIVSQASGGEGRKGIDTMVVPAGSGSVALAGPAREYVENFFGRSMGHVRIHADHEAERAAEAIGAYAFTVGRDIYFGKGQFKPDTPEGMALLVHELTHVVQQGDGIARKAIAGVAADAVALEKIWKYERPVQPKARAAGGRPLELDERRAIEETIGAEGSPVQPKVDLSRVRVRTGPEAAESAESEGAEAYASGDAIVLSRKAQADVAAGDGAILAHEAVHVGQQQRGLVQAKRTLFQEWLLEQEAVEAESRALVQPKLSFGIGARLFGGRASARLAIEIGDDDHRQEAPAGGGTGQQADGGDAHGGATGQTGGGTGQTAGGTGQTAGGGTGQTAGGGAGEPAATGQTGGNAPPPPVAPEEAEQKKTSENLIHRLMRFFGVRPHVGEEEFLDEITERVMDMMEEELLIDSERKATNAPFGAPF